MPRPMDLATLIDNLPIDHAAGPEAKSLPPIAEITEDSRAVTPGSLFIARPGETHDGRDFLDDAIRAGAVAILASTGTTIGRASITLMTCDDVPAIGAKFCEHFCGNPSRALQLVGVTGTNGKTTTAFLIQQILNDTLNRRCGLMGTVHTDDGRAIDPAALTTPAAREISGTLERMVNHGCGAAVMEVSSHALQQRRTDGLIFAAAVFTNLSGDHMDYHGSEEAYFNAKARLFEQLAEDSVAIINSDDPRGESLASRTDAHVLRCSLQNKSADFYAVIDRATILGVDVQLIARGETHSLHLPLCGRHNVMNALQAAATASALGVSMPRIVEALARCHAPPGRLEPVTLPNNPFSVYVDYAHTDDALENVLSAVRPLVPDSGRLRVIFGCGGDRDRTKRPRMAQVAARYGDEIIITSDNPRTEDPDTIVAEVAAGIPAAHCDRAVQCVDRREAITMAIRTARPGDVIVIAGKGHEDYQIIGREKRPFDDRVIAREALRVAQSRVTAGPEASAETTDAIANAAARRAGA
ncbi:MAG: UDP-N-acetylmuramoyl-L-alanyl-D-glutamate--2,6-diaminopimelate ligase [Phycisphaerales bacterium]|nr:MAG: UDP-N-acetylmuramoyl-L-alanyl-D-glutamate--2,6-diaminopimelate ligase [Phycisphaerales bacterium]